jgi:hypothetical protein
MNSIITDSLIELLQIKTTVGLQVVDGKFGQYPNTGGAVSNGQTIALLPDSPFEDDDWFTFHSVVCRPSDDTSNDLSNDTSNDGT